MKKVLVLCTGNSCRSQIAEGYLKAFLNGEAEVHSAGVENHAINENAIKIMTSDCTCVRARDKLFVILECSCECVTESRLRYRP